MRHARKTGLIIFALLLAWLFAEFYERRFANWIEPVAQEAWSALRGKSTPPSNIVIVSIDKDSREKLGVPLLSRDQWPFALYYDDIDAATLSSFVNAMHESEARSIGVFTGFFPSGGTLINQLASGAFNEATSPLKVHVALQRGYFVPSDTTFSGFSFVSLPPRAIQSRHRSDIPEDPEYSQRLSFDWTARWFYDESLYNDKSPLFPEVISGVARKNGPDANDLIRFYGPSGTFPTVSLAQVLSDTTLGRSGFFKDKIVLLGHGKGYDDNFYETDFRTPLLGQALYPIEIIATQTANIIDGSWIRRLSAKTERNIMFVLALGILVAYCFLEAPRVARSVVGLFIVWVAGSFLAFTMGFFVPGLSLFAFVGLGGFLTVVTTEVLKTSSRGQTLNYDLTPESVASLDSLKAAQTAICSHFGANLIIWRRFYEDLSDKTQWAYLGCLLLEGRTSSQKGEHIYLKVQNLPHEILANWNKAISLFYEKAHRSALAPFAAVGNADCVLSLAAWRYVEDIARRHPELSVEIPTDWSEKMDLCDKGIRFFIPLEEYQLSDGGPCQNVSPWEH